MTPAQEALKRLVQAAYDYVPPCFESAGVFGQEVKRAEVFLQEQSAHDENQLEFYFERKAA